MRTEWIGERIRLLALIAESLASIDEQRPHPPIDALYFPPLTPPSAAAITRGMADPPSDPPTLTFEAALRGLEDIVRRLETGDVPLDESIALYEEGEKLRAQCQARLEAAQARIERIVTNAQGQATGTQPFDAPQA